MKGSVVTLAVLATIGFVIALAVGAPDPGDAERAYAAAIGILAISVFARWLDLASRGNAGRGTDPSAARLGRRPEDQVEDEVVDPARTIWRDLERSIRLGSLSAGNFDLLVRPRLEALARSRPGGAELLVPGSILSSTCPRWHDRSGPGATVREIEAIVDQVERP